MKIVDEVDIEVATGNAGQDLIRGGHDACASPGISPKKRPPRSRGDGCTPGDAGYVNEDGYSSWSTWLKDMIISGGENIYSTEVENAVAKHPAVASAKPSSGCPDDRWGERGCTLLSRAMPVRR